MEEKVRCFELGADDYIVKPFAFAEFGARVHAVLRRGPKETSESLTIGSLALERFQQRATRDARLIALTPKEYLLLKYLMQNQNRVASRSKLLANVWGDACEVSSGIVDACIHQLRAKTEASSEARMIHTVRGVGYVMQCDR